MLFRMRLLKGRKQKQNVFRSRYSVTVVIVLYRNSYRRCINSPVRNSSSCSAVKEDFLPKPFHLYIHFVPFDERGIPSFGYRNERLPSGRFLLPVCLPESNTWLPEPVKASNPRRSGCARAAEVRLMTGMLYSELLRRVPRAYRNCRIPVSAV